MINTQSKTKITLFEGPPVSVMSIAFLMLLFAKLFGYSNMSWWWVTCPLWGPFAVCAAIFILYLIIVGTFGGAMVICTCLVAAWTGFFDWLDSRKISRRLKKEKNRKV